MHLKFLKRGTGSAAVAAAYLLADKDAAGKTRASVEVLRGDPNLVAAVADGLPFEHRYTSGVCAWSAEDAPTRSQIERFIDEFERTAWPGLDPERYVWSVVVHRDDDGGVHLHIFAARCDLATGLSLNIAPPGWRETFDPLRDAFNWEYGWSRPDDPARARPSRPTPGRVHWARAARRSGEDVEPDPREELGKHLLGLVAAGQVRDRAGVVAALKECGYEVPRQGRHYVTARNPETGERWRLKGVLYERDFDGEQFMPEAPERSGDRERAGVGGSDASSAAAEAWAAVEDKRRQRAEYHRKHYGLSSSTSSYRVGNAGSGVGDDAERESGSAAAPVAGRDTSLAAHLQRELGNDAVVAVTEVAVTESAETTRDRSPDAGAGRGERGLVPAAALAGAARAAGPDLSRALSEHIAIRERAVCATSMGEQWLATAQEVVVEDRALTVGERAHAVETVEGQLDADLSRRESELQAMSLGPSLLSEFGELVDARHSFATRARGLEQVEARVVEVLTVQEEALRSIPFGRQCLSEVFQGRSGDVVGRVAVPLAEWESRLRMVEQQVRDELDRLEKEHVARAGHEDLLVEATRVLVKDSRSLSLGERWAVYERAESRYEEEQQELDREETTVRKGADGEEYLRNARLEVLGAADREGTLAERARIVKAAKALQTAAEAKQRAEQERETRRWEEQRDAAVQALGCQPGRLDLFYAHLADLDPEWDRKRNDSSSRENIDAALAAAESDDTRLGRLRVVLSDKVDATRYGEELGKVAGQFKTSDLDRALAAAERERETRLWEEQEAATAKRRDARLSKLFAGVCGDETLVSVLDAHKPAWRETGSPTDIDNALDMAELRVDRTKPAPEEHAVVVDAEQTFPATPSAAFRQAGAWFPEGSTHARVARRLADRTLVRARAAGHEEPSASADLVQRLFEWLRAAVEKLLERMSPTVRKEPSARHDGDIGRTGGTVAAVPAPSVAPEAGGVPTIAPITPLAPEQHPASQARSSRSDDEEDGEQHSSGREEYEEQVRRAAASAMEVLPQAMSSIVNYPVFLIPDFGRLKERARDGYMRDTISEVEREQSNKDANHRVGAAVAAEARAAAVQDHLTMRVQNLIAEHKKKASRGGFFGRQQWFQPEPPPTFDDLMRQETERHESKLLTIFETACDRSQQHGRSESAAEKVGIDDGEETRRQQAAEPVYPDPEYVKSSLHDLADKLWKDHPGADWLLAVRLIDDRHTEEVRAKMLDEQAERRRGCEKIVADQLYDYALQPDVPERAPPEHGTTENELALADTIAAVVRELFTSRQQDGPIGSGAIIGSGRGGAPGGRAGGILAASPVSGQDTGAEQLQALLRRHGAKHKLSEIQKDDALKPDAEQNPKSNQPASKTLGTPTPPGHGKGWQP